MTAPGGTGRRAAEAARFEAFVRQHQHMVFGTAVRLLANAAEAEDIAQTVFLRAYERFAALSRSPQAAGWLKTVTRNLCLNHLSRYRSRWQLFSEFDRAAESPAGPALWSSQRSPSAALEQTERAAHLERALAQLPDHQRVPLVLFHFEELSYEQIAEALGVSVGKVKTDIHRGRERLRKELWALDGTR